MCRESYVEKRRNGVFYFRMRVPADIQPWMPVTEIRRSTRARTLKAARRRANVLQHRTQQLFERIRSGMYNEEEIRRLVRRYVDEQLAANEENRWGPNQKWYRGMQQDLAGEGLEELIEKVRKQIASYDREAMTKAASFLVEKFGLHDLEPGSDAFMMLGHSKLKGDLEVLRVELERSRGNFANVYDSLLDGKRDAAPQPVGQPPRTEPVAAKRISEAAEMFYEEHRIGQRWRKATFDENKVALDLLIEILGDRLLPEIAHSDMLEVRDTIRKLPPNRSKDPRFRELGIDRVVAMKGIPRLSLTRVNNLLVKIGGFFNWAEAHELVSHSPAKKLKIPVGRTAKQQRLPFSTDELQTILDKLPDAVRSPCRRPEHIWVTLIGMFSGMRLTEICQLLVEDVHEVATILCFDVNDKGDTKKLKTPSAERLVPVHSQLVELGFGDYIEYRRRNKDTRLWPELKGGRDGQGHYLSRWFTRFNREHVTQDSRKVFHSLRHNFTTALQNSDADANVIAQLVGHALHGETFGRYGKGFGIQLLHETIEKLDYALDMTKIGTATRVTWPH